MSSSLATHAVGPLAAALILASSTTAIAAPPATDPDPWFSRDKMLHFGVSAGIAGVSYGLTAAATDDIRIRIAFGSGAGIVVGAAKELIDLAGAGTPSWKDFAWDVLGTAVGVGIAISIDLIARSLRPNTSAAAAH